MSGVSPGALFREEAGDGSLEGGRACHGGIRGRPRSTAEGRERPNDGSGRPFGRIAVAVTGDQPERRSSFAQSLDLIAEPGVHRDVARPQWLSTGG